MKSKLDASKNIRMKGRSADYSPLDRDFFKKWSNEMAYVLGFIYADGNVGHRLYTFSISQKELEPLEKIKVLLRSEYEIRANKHGLHRLEIASKEMVDDLLKLGLTPNKSLTIQFPNMQEKFVNHFVRGYFDGDGSVHFCKNWHDKHGGAWRVSITTGSTSFLGDLKNNLERFAGVSKRPIYTKLNNKACEIKYGSESDICKLYRFFYDDCTLNQKLFLERKYMKFGEALQFMAKRG